MGVTKGLKKLILKIIKSRFSALFTILCLYIALSFAIRITFLIWSAHNIDFKFTHIFRAFFTGFIFDVRTRQHYYNTIAGLGEGLGFYHKRRLVPFGEYVPLEDYLRGLIEFFNLPTSFINLGPEDQHGLIAHGIRITPAVCYEIVYPDLIAKAARETQVLLNVNNLGWFLDSIQSKQFMQMAQMRALETGRYLIYSTNNGPSAIIDNKGKVTSQSKSFTEQTFSGVIHPVKDWTPFMVIGSWPLGLLACLILAGFKLPLFIPRIRQKLFRMPSQE